MGNYVITSCKPFELCRKDLSICTEKSELRFFGQGEDWEGEAAATLYLDASEEIWPEERRSVAFHSHMVVPSGWELTSETAPLAFQKVGRDARVIVATRANEAVELNSVRQTLVLWATSESSVDTCKAELLLRTAPFHRELFRIWSFERITSLGALAAVVQYPEGLTLQDYILDMGFLSEGCSSRLCRSLLMLMRDVHHAQLHFWGFLSPWTVYLDRTNAGLKGVLPLGLLFSSRGFMAAHHVLGRQCKSPEFDSVVSHQQRQELDTKWLEGNDMFSVGALVLDSMGLLPSSIYSKGQPLPISSTAFDFFVRALHRDPALRIPIENALLHPWLREQKVQELR